MKILLKEGDTFYSCMCQKFELVKIDKENDEVVIETKKIDLQEGTKQCTNTKREELLEKQIENIMSEKEANLEYYNRVAAKMSWIDVYKTLL